MPHGTGDRGARLVGCQSELREALSDWIALRLRLGLPIPVLAGIDLNQIMQSVSPLSLGGSALTPHP